MDEWVFYFLLLSVFIIGKWEISETLFFNTNNILNKQRDYKTLLPISCVEADCEFLLDCYLENFDAFSELSLNESVTLLLDMVKFYNTMTSSLTDFSYWVRLNNVSICCHSNLKGWSREFVLRQEVDCKEFKCIFNTVLYSHISNFNLKIETS